MRILTSSDFPFAHHTIKHRLPSVIDRILCSNQFDSAIIEQLETLKKSLASGDLIASPQEALPDSEEWKLLFEQNLKGVNWFNVEWFIAETYFYRKILENVEFFSTKKDPFHSQKMQELKENYCWELVEKSLENIENSSLSEENLKDAIKSQIALCVWGNRADLCYLSVSNTNKDGGFTTNSLLIDDSDVVASHLLTGKPRRVGIICDNTGAELLMDLMLAALLLRRKVASEVCLFVKRYPTFVSDATMKDVEITVAEIGKCGFAQKAYDALRIGMNEGKLVVSDDSFWNSGKFFTEIPLELANSLEKCEFLFIKGDANYRRLLRDEICSVDASFKEITEYFRSDGYVCLRTLKSDPICGISKEAEENLLKEDPQWRTNGKRGIVQASFGSQKSPL